MHNLNLPLSWILSDIPEAHYGFIPLDKKRKWIYTAQIPNKHTFQNTTSRIKFLEEKNNKVIRGCDENFRKFLSSLDYNSIRIGQEAVLDLQANHFEKKSLKKLIQRGNRQGNISEKKFPFKHISQLNDLKLHSAHGNKPQLSYLFNSKLKNDMRLFAFEQQDGVWLAALTISRQAMQKYQVEILMRRKNSPVGIMESLIFKTAKILKKEGCRYFSLGEVPFINSKKSSKFFSKDFIISTIGRSFRFAYNYKGLYRFKNKFAPKWYDIYLCSQKPISLQLFYALFRKTGFNQLVKFSILDKIRS